MLSTTFLDDVPQNNFLNLSIRAERNGDYVIYFREGGWGVTAEGRARAEIVLIRRPNIVMSEYMNRRDAPAAQPAVDNTAGTCSPYVTSSTRATKC